MKFSVRLLRTPIVGYPVMRACVTVDTLNPLEAACVAIAVMEEAIPGTYGEWWAVAAVPTQPPQWYDKSFACDI